MIAKEILKLHNNWEFRQSGTNKWKPATVPGCVHTDLLALNEIEDPFYGSNAKKLQWIEEKNWEYRCLFDPPANMLEKNVIELNFNGLDTIATVYLNGTQIIRADNMHRKHVSSVKGRLIEGKNEIRVIFSSPYIKGLKKLEAYGFQLPASNEEVKHKVSPYIRKAAYMFGWDWGPRIVTSGIWRDVYISGWNIAQIEDLQIIQGNINEDYAEVKCRFEIQSIRRYDAMLIINHEGKTWQEKCISLKEGINHYDIDLEIDNPELWWPNGVGNPHLYKIDCKLEVSGEVIETIHEAIGLRTVELIREPDKLGSSFHFEINGKELFIKGANVIPFDFFPTRVTREKYEQVLQTAVDANFNMVRVWGGAYYEDDYFYQLCDEKGLLVWQDFMFACCMYPANEEFLETVREEAIYNIKRLRNHTCIAIWCGNNELLEAFHTWGWKEELGKNADKAFEDYEKVFYDLLPEVLKEYAPVKQYWPSSPSAGWNDILSLNSGDYHYWDIIKQDLPLTAYQQNVGRFMSEYGFKGYPEIKTLNTYSEEKDWDLRSEVMEFHQGWFRGADLIELNMERELRKPKDWESFLYASQILQAEALKIAIEAHRRNKPYCMGTMYWMLNDVWPTATWATVDYYGRWKAAHYYIKKLYQDILISLHRTEDFINIYIVSDKMENISGDFHLQLISFDGKIHWKEKHQVAIAANTNHCVMELNINEVIKNEDPQKCFIYTCLESKGEVVAEKCYFFLRLKNLELPDVKISRKIQEKDGKISITLESDKLAKNVFLSLGEKDGFFSDNYFDLLPGKEKTVSLTSNEKTDHINDALQIKSLIDTFK